MSNALHDWYDERARISIEGNPALKSKKEKKVNIPTDREALKELRNRFDKAFPPFRGVGAQFPIFEETPNREWIWQFIESETAAAYAKGFNEGTLNPNKWLCPICNVILKSRVRELHESTHREGDAKEKP